jgi:two-component system capsular synthesis sensor histidine kinase RcsC
LRFDIIDSGIGISDAQLAQLFEPFSQADASISRRLEGEGFGLALCHQLSKLLGGSIRVQSTSGVGSIFSLELPVAPDTTPQIDNSTLFAGERVALLSSAVEWRTEISALLNSWGAEVAAVGHPSGLDVEWVRHAKALLVFGMPSSWNDDAERVLTACASSVIRALTDGPLIPERRDGALHISCYSSAALQSALRQGGVVGSSPGQLNAAMSRRVAVVQELPVAGATNSERRTFPEKVLSAFVESGAHDLDTMMTAWRTNDPVVLLERLHSLKGALFMLGEHPLARACAVMETHVEADGLGAMNDALVELEHQLREVLDRYAADP